MLEMSCSEEDCAWGVNSMPLRMFISCTSSMYLLGELVQCTAHTRIFIIPSNASMATLGHFVLVLERLCSIYPYDIK